MVLTPARLLDPSAACPDARRITALACALALNLAALMALSLPREQPLEAAPLRAEPYPIIEALLIRDRPEPVAQPVPPVPPPPLRTVATPAPAPPAPVSEIPGHIPAPAPVPAPVTTLELAPGLPASATGVVADRAASVAYDRVTPPPYPPIALRRGLEGLVVLNVLVGEDGRPLAVEIERGSGHRLLDREARAHVLANWRFHPAIVGGEPVRAWAKVPVSFRITDH